MQRPQRYPNKLCCVFFYIHDLIANTVLSFNLCRWVDIQTSTAALKVLRSTVLIWVVLVGALVLDIMLIVHLLCIITSLSLGLLLVEPVLTLRLGQLVYLRTSESGK
jgi:hypothetical protein